ncbi:MAG: tungstate ABC transporter substrate-binding protein WtpA [Bacteroidota bacterium]|nr:tungstate ABC transporter substrate-binding protein WtpA [Bacteroidota bacterium]
MRRCIGPFIFALALIFLSACGGQSARNSENAGISGELIIFHAGSLSVPFQQIADTFSKLHPGLKIYREAAGSVSCARKITELNKACDIMASADYDIINKLLIPEQADWNIKFASNEMVIAYDDNSRYQKQINPQNWFDILLKEDVSFGRSDPNSDPCGYRSVLVSKLASVFYKQPVLYQKILAKDQEYIRPKETELLALLQTGSIDYMFIYRSVAEQHKLKYVRLPDSINLKNPKLAAFYEKVEVKINGDEPGEYITQRGEPMVYGLSICKNAPNRAAAIEFVQFLLSADKGMKIMEKNGQPSVVPSYTNTYTKLPDELKVFAKNK